MGICETNNNNMKKGLNNIQSYQMHSMLQQSKNICKILKDEITIGIGFLCYIPGENKKRKTLITTYHVLGEEDLKIGKEINLSIYDFREKLIKIKIDKLSVIYANEYDDIVMVEVEDIDNLSDKMLLEIDENIFTINDYNSKYQNQDIYILDLSDRYRGVTFGTIEKIENNTIYHSCKAKLSSGAPLLNIDTFKVIGIHQEYNEEIKCNKGIILKESIDNLITKRIMLDFQKEKNC